MEVSYVNANLPSKLIRFCNFPSEIQCIPIELNISTKKYALLSIYRPNQNINFFLDKLSEALNSKNYENICIFGDFNATPENNRMINFVSNQSFSNLIKSPTCFKSENGSMIDVFLTTNKYLFQKTNFSKDFNQSYCSYGKNFLGITLLKINLNQRLTQFSLDISDL